MENANYHLSWVNTGVAVYDGQSGAGVALCPQDSPLVSLGEPGRVQVRPALRAQETLCLSQPL